MYSDLIRTHLDTHGTDPAELAAVLAALAVGDDGPQAREEEAAFEAQRAEARDARKRRDDDRAPRERRDGERPSRGVRRESTGTRYRLSVGHTHGAQPSGIVGALTNEGGLSGKDLGKIDIFPSFSLVDISAPLDSETIDKISRARVAGKALRIKLDAGYPRRPGGSIDWRALRTRVKALLAEYEIDADPRQPINELRPADRTMVAIARALQDQENDELILVLDEPTASLAAQESNQLLENVRRRADKGQTIVIVSHRLQEVLSIAHDFTIFRDGEVVGELTDAHPTEDELVRTMAGGLVQALRPDDLEEHVAGETVLEITDLHSGPIHGVNLTVKAGEIVGIAGLVGSGRSSLLQAVFGAPVFRHHADAPVHCLIDVAGRESRLVQ